MTEIAESRLFGNLTPESVIQEAEERYGPFKARVCLFSGGNDSLATAHRCKDLYDLLVFVDTGTAVPGVVEFVHEAAEWLGKELKVYNAPEGEYERMILGGLDARGVDNEALGFPGPMMHGRCYNRLKERAIEQMRRELKGDDRKARTLALTGLRRAESARRAQRKHISTRGSLVFANPLIDWAGSDLHTYRRENNLIESDVAALIHRSGECNCGAYARPGEREELQTFWPEWFDSFIGKLEREAEAAGLARCKWGNGFNEQPTEEAGELCSDCQLRLAA